jgi:hypothetical protein
MATTRKDLRQQDEERSELLRRAAEKAADPETRDWVARTRKALADGSVKRPAAGRGRDDRR